MKNVTSAELFDTMLVLHANTLAVYSLDLTSFLASAAVRAQQLGTPLSAFLKSAEDAYNGAKKNMPDITKMICDAMVREVHKDAPLP